MRTTTFVTITSQPRTQINFDLPANTCDCHTHIFGDPQQFQMTPSRIYTPEPTSVEKIRTLHRTLHMEHIVIVQPSIYNTNNACTLDAIKQLRSRAHAITIIDDKTSNATLADLDRANVRSIQLNLETANVVDPTTAHQRMQSTLDRLRNSRWHIQINTQPPMIETIRDQITSAPMPFVFDHFGNLQTSRDLEQPGFDALVQLIRSKSTYVKISGTYRSSTQAPDYADAAPFAKALITTNPQRIL